MFSLTRTTAQRAPRGFIRSFSDAVNADIQHAPPIKAGPSNGRGRSRVAKRATELPPLSKTKVPVPADHGLYAFFRKTNTLVTGEGQYEVVETPDQGQLATGRAWEAAELRNKSFKDLHTLWYVVLRERNLLATQKEEARRMGVSNTNLQVPMDKVRHCRKTMARIKLVLNERRLAYEGAVQIAQEEVDIAKRELERRLAQKPEQRKQQQKPAPYDVYDRQVLLIQQPKTTKSKASKSRVQPQEERAPEPEKPASPWNAHRAYGNYRVSQIGEPKPKQANKQPGRRRGVPKPRPLKN